jgi:L-iditol 2-dehydrogenase
MGWYLERKAPLVFGHEVAGEIESIGEDVTDFRPGDRVFVHHHAPCLRCRFCRRGDHVHCAEWRRSGIAPGGMAEFFLVPAGTIARDTLRLSEEVDFETAALVEPTACVVKSLRRAAVRTGDRVLVIGLGIMGQLHVALARHFGAAEVIGTDLDPWRCSRALEVGADSVIDAGRTDVVASLRDRTGGEMADVVIVGPGSVEAIRLGIDAAASGARVVLFTSTRPGDVVPLPVHDVYFREVTLVPSYSCGPEDTREALARLSRGEIPTQLLITHRFPLERIADAYRTAADRSGSLKTLIVFPEGRSGEGCSSP